MAEIDSKKNKVLIVEDEESLREVLGDALSMRGIDVISAVDGQDGLMKALSEKPDIILLDILMPRMDGKATLKALRENDSTKNTPVMFLTNLNELDIISEAVSSDVNDYIVKSDWSIAEIVKKVEAKLKSL